MENITIRQAAMHDIKDCVELSQIKEFEGPKGQFPDADDLNSGLKSGIFLVAKTEEKIVGFALGYIMSRKIGGLDLLTVNSEYRGQGIGRRLLEAFEKELQKHRIEHISLIAPLESKDDDKFYKHNGFMVEGKYQLFKRNL